MFKETVPSRVLDGVTRQGVRHTFWLPREVAEELIWVGESRTADGLRLLRRMRVMGREGSVADDGRE